MARHIAQMAARLFATRGYDATSVREIVAAAGVTKPTLYYHFGSKEGLAQALLTRPMSLLLDDLRVLVEDGRDPVAMMAAMLERHFQFCREDPDRSRFLYALFFGPLSSSLSAEIAGVAEGMTEVMGAGVVRMAEAGCIDPARSSDFLASLRGLLVIQTMDYLYRGGELGPDLAQSLVNDLLRGFGQHETEKE